MAIETPKGREPRGDKVGDVDQDIAKYEALLAQDPRSRAFALLAEAFRKHGLHDEAINVALEGLKHHPYYLSGRMALARAYFDSNQKALARQEFERVIAAAPDNLMAHRHLAEIYLGEGRAVDAARALKMVVLLDPRDEKARERLMGLSGGDNAPPAVSAPPAEGGFESLLEGHRYEEARLQPAEPPKPMPAAGPAVTAPMTAPASEPPLPKTTVAPEPAIPLAAPETPIAPPAAQAASPLEPPESTFDLGAETGLLEEGILPSLEADAFLEPAAPESRESPWGELERKAPAVEPPGELDTETLAEIYIQQGFYDKALAIYQRILAGQPGNVTIGQKIEELKTRLKMPEGEEREIAGLSGREAEALKTLRQWLDRLNKGRR